MNLPLNAGKFLTSWDPGSFSRRNLLHGVSKYHVLGQSLRQTDPPPRIKRQTMATYKHLTGKQKTIPNNVLKWQQIMVTKMHGYNPSPSEYTTRILRGAIRNRHVVATSPLLNMAWFEQALRYSLAHAFACCFTLCRGKYGEFHDYVDNYLAWNSRMQAKPRLHTLIVSNSHAY
jgi:hypothetical protein